MAIITTDSQHYSNIAEQIRTATNSDAEFYPAEMSERIAEVYEAGKQTENDAFWDLLQENGDKVDYNYAFYRLNFNRDNFKPKYDVKPTSAQDIFNSCPSYRDLNIALAVVEGKQVVMKDLEEELGIKFDFSKCTNFIRAFTGILFSELNVIDMTGLSASNSSTNTQLAFYGGYASNQLLPLRLKRIEKIIVNDKVTIHSGAFNYQVNLSYIGFEGTIANNLNLSACPLVPESMKSAILCLKNYAGTGEEFSKTIQFSSDCWAALEADSKSPDGGTWQEYVASLGWNA